MDLATIEPMLAAWVARLAEIPTGLVVWENAPRPASPTGLLGTLSWPSTSGKGVDETRWEKNAAAPGHADPHTVTPTLVGIRGGTLQVTIETHDQRSGQTARNLCERLRDRARMPSSLAALRAANVGLVRVERTNRLDAMRDDRMMSVAAIDVLLNLTAFTRDTNSAGTSVIETADVTTHIDGAPAGLQWTDEEIPLP